MIQEVSPHTESGNGLECQDVLKINKVDSRMQLHPASIVYARFRKINRKANSHKIGNTPQMRFRNASVRTISCYSLSTMIHWHWHEYKGHKGKCRNTSWGKPTAVLCVGTLFLLVALERSLWGQQKRELIRSGELTTGNIKRQTLFDELAHMSYTMSSAPASTKRLVFELSRWKQSKPNGGLRDDDYTLLGKIYGDADSVFEFGLGESTLLANHLGLPRYVGLDSDPSYITLVREKVSSHFRFMWADTGKTDVWGRPEKLLAKNVYNYQIAPLVTEYKAFDVYMLNGSWRLPCLFASFLHASARKMEAKGLILPLDQSYDTNTTVVLYDCFGQEGNSPPKTVDIHDRNREIYRAADHLLDLVAHSGQRLCVYKRKDTTSDQDLLDLWVSYYNETG